MADWNELDFLGRQEFRQMAPSIIQLEITRLGHLIDSQQEDLDFHNALVKSRFALKRFIECLQATAEGPLSEACISHLRTATLILTAARAHPASSHAKTLQYILDRLHYVLNRSEMLY